MITQKMLREIYDEINPENRYVIKEVKPLPNYKVELRFLKKKESVVVDLKQAIEQSWDPEFIKPAYFKKVKVTNQSGLFSIDWPNGHKFQADWLLRQADSLIKNIDSSMSCVYNEIKTRSDENYDGVVGELPAWVPKQLRRDFISAQNNLFRFCREVYQMEGKHAHRQIGKWAGNLIALQSPRQGEVQGIVPPEAIKDLNVLIYTKHIVDLGKEKGLKAFLGRKSAKVFEEIKYKERQKKNAQKDRPNNPLQSFIEQTIKKMIQSGTQVNISLVLRKLRIDADILGKDEGTKIEFLGDEMIWHDDKEMKSYKRSMASGALKTQIARVKNSLSSKK